jgi:ABC-type thiamine transport system substrate-binding protein
MSPVVQEQETESRKAELAAQIKKELTVEPKGMSQQVQEWVDEWMDG